MMCPFQDKTACSNNCALFIVDKTPYAPGMTGKCSIAVIAENIKKENDKKSN